MTVIARTEATPIRPSGAEHERGVVDSDRTSMSGDVLGLICSPAHLDPLSPEQLDALAAETRAFLIEKVSASGGHLGPNLGVVELTIAIHRVFDSPRDALIFDTGHQAYVHKILTGRQDGFDRLRASGGLSGYPSRVESEHDWVESSHASAGFPMPTGWRRHLNWPVPRIGASLRSLVMAH